MPDLTTAVTTEQIRTDVALYLMHVQDRQQKAGN